MKDIKELIFAAVEENAVKFQELAYDQLHARAYEAIESLRPEVAASMFGEAKEMEDDEESEDEDDKDEKKSEKKSEVDEELKGNQHKIDKNKNGKIDAHDFKLLRKEEVEQIDEISAKTLATAAKAASDPDADYAYDKSHDASKFAKHATKKFGAKIGSQIAKAASGDSHFPKRYGSDGKTVPPGSDKLADRQTNRITKGGKVHKQDVSALKNKIKNEEVEQIDELSTDKLTAYTKAAKASRAELNKKWTQGKASWRDKEKVINREKGENRAHKIVDRRALVDKEMKEGTDIQEVAHPQNQADWQALINHQIKVTGHPVATDAQFRAPHGKDMSKIASLEPGEDKAQYAKAQGGNVKP